MRKLEEEEEEKYKYIYIDLFGYWEILGYGKGKKFKVPEKSA